MKQRFANFIVSRRRIVLAIMVILSLVSAFFIPRVTINTDLTKYLADSSSMKLGMQLMEEEFPEMAQTQTIRVMAKGLTEAEKQELKDRLQDIPYVDSVSHDSGEAYNKGDYTLYLLGTSYDYGSKEEQTIESALESDFPQYQLTVQNDDTDFSDLPPSLIILALGLLMAILFLMCSSWAEPFLFMIAIGMAVILNLGTNIFLGSISNVTFSIAAILQLVLSMDYSIILMNRYRQEKRNTADKQAAMKSALVHAFSSIASSSLTTIVGLLALVFMSFKIGMDLGIVLAKGVLISMICIFTALPGLILGSSRLIEKTAKKELHISMNPVAAFSYRFRRVLSGGFAVLFVAFYFLQGNTKTAYTLEREDPIAEIFPSSNPIVMVYPNEDEQAVREIAQAFESHAKVRSIESYATTLGRRCNVQDLAQAMGELSDNMQLDSSMLGMIYYDYFAKEELPSMSVSEFIRFLSDDVLNQNSFAQYLDSSMLEQSDRVTQFADRDALIRPMNAQELADFFGFRTQDARQLMLYFYTVNGGVDPGTMSLQSFAQFVLQEVGSNPTYSSMIEASSRSQLQTLSTFTDAKAMTAPLSTGEIAKLLSLKEDDVKLLFAFYFANSNSYQPRTMTIPAFVRFLQEDLAANPQFSGYLDSASLSQIQQLSLFTSRDQNTKQRTGMELAAVLGIEPALMDQVFSLYFGSQGGSVTLSSFLEFLVHSILENEQFAGSFDDTAKAQLVELNGIVQASAKGEKFAPQQLSGILGLHESLTAQLFQMYFQTAQLQDTHRLTLVEFTTFLVNDILTNSAFSGYFDDAAGAQLKSIHQLAVTAASGQELTAAQMVPVLGIDEALLSQLVSLYFAQNTQGKTMSLEQLSDFLVTNILPNSAFAPYFTQESKDQLGLMNTVIKASLAETAFTDSQMAELFRMDPVVLRLIYAYSDIQDSGNASQRLSVQELVGFILENRSSLGTVLDSSILSQLALAQTFIGGAVSGKQYSPSQLAQLLDMDADTLEQIYLLYQWQSGDTNAWKLSAQQFVSFLCSNILKDTALSQNLAGGLADELPAAKVLIDAVVSGEDYTPAKMAELLGSMTDEMDAGTVSLLYLYRASQQNSSPEWKLSIQEFFTYLNDTILEDSRFAPMIDTAMRQQIADGKTQLEEGASQLQGPHYSRLIFNTVLPGESEETTAFLDRLHQLSGEKLTGDYYLIGNSAMNYEMQQSFSGELTFITLLTAIAIFLVVALTFRSFIIPLILVCIVQCGVFITVTVIGVQGYSIYYLALLIVECILMGATIDYGILFTNNYREQRQLLPPRDALREAYHSSIHTIMTSGLIMILVTGIIGYTFWDPTIAQICRTISTGALCATLLILLILPGLLATFDRFVCIRPKNKGESSSR